MPKQSDDLSRDGEPKQRTKSGLTIPVPEREEVMDLFKKAARPEPQPKANGRGTRRTSRDR
jgi:hypothetical protein